MCFKGVGVFTNKREIFAILADDQTEIKQIGPFANSVMNEAEKASAEMGVGPVSIVHVECESGHVIVKCHYESADQLIPEPGKAHVHIIMLLSTQANIGLAKVKMEAVIDKLGEDFWVWCRIKQFWQYQHTNK